MESRVADETEIERWKTQLEAKSRIELNEKLEEVRQQYPGRLSQIKTTYRTAKMWSWFWGGLIPDVTLSHISNLRNMTTSELRLHWSNGGWSYL